MTLRTRSYFTTGVVLLCGVVLLAACGNDEPAETSAQTTSTLEEGDSGECAVAGRFGSRWRTMRIEHVDHWEDCHDVAFRAGDEYCDGLREGKSGPNPIRLWYGIGAGYHERYWTFGCAGVPED
jgi:hypothetical protein